MNQEKIGKFIAELRKEHNMTQKQLAQNLNITDAAISKWERGNGCPDITLIEDLSNILEVSINEILAGERIEKITKEQSDQIIKNSIKSYTAIEKRKIIKKGIIITIVLIIFSIIMFFTINQIRKDGGGSVYGISWSTLSNIYYSKKYFKALQNNDYDRLQKLILPSSKTNDDGYFDGNIKTSEEYIEKLKELNRLGVSFIEYKYSHTWFNDINFSAEYTVTLKYQGKIAKIEVSTDVHAGKITGISTWYKTNPEEWQYNEEIWAKIVDVFTY